MENLMNHPFATSAVEPFVRASTSQIRAHRGHLVADLDASFTHARMRAVFGPANDLGWRDDENGYDGEEWVFADRAGETFKVYARWGHFRVGAMNDVAAETFVAWIRSRL